MHVHRHHARLETVVTLRGKIKWVFYDDNGIETERVVLDTDGDLRMLNVEKNSDCLASGSVLYECKVGRGGCWRKVRLSFIGDVYCLTEKFYICIMELKYEDIQRLLAIEKCVDASMLQNNMFTLPLTFPVQQEIHLFSAMGDVEFRWIIDQSRKVSFKITLFVMEKENNLGLLRLDYVPISKFHKNPDSIEGNIPPGFKSQMQLIGKVLI